MDDLNVIADEAQVIAGGVAEAQLVFLGATVLAVGAASWLTPRLQRMGHRWSVRWMQVWLLVLGAMTPTFPLLYLWAQGFFPIMMVLLAAFVALHAGPAMPSRARSHAVVSTWSLVVCMGIVGSRLPNIAETGAPDTWAYVLSYDIATKLSVGLLWGLDQVGLTTAAHLYDNLLSRFLRVSSNWSFLMLALSAAVVSIAAFGVRLVTRYRSRPWVRFSHGPAVSVLVVGGLWSCRAQAAAQTFEELQRQAVSFAPYLAPVLGAHVVAVLLCWLSPRALSINKALTAASLCLGLIGLAMTLGGETSTAYDLAKIAVAWPAAYGVWCVVRAGRGYQRWGLWALLAIIVGTATGPCVVVCALVGTLCTALGLGPRLPVDRPTGPPERLWRSVVVMAIVVSSAPLLWAGFTWLAASQMVTTPAFVEAREVRVQGDEPSLYAAAARACQLQGLCLCESRQLVSERKPVPESQARLLLTADVLFGRRGVVCDESAWLQPWPPRPVLVPRQLVLPEPVVRRGAEALARPVWAACCPNQSKHPVKTRP